MIKPHTRTVKKVPNARVAAKATPQPPKPPKLQDPRYIFKKFGKHQTPKSIKLLVRRVWGSVFAVANVQYINYTWKADVRHNVSGKIARDVRVDYLINYLRPPQRFYALPDVKQAREALIARFKATKSKVNAT